MSRIAVVGNCHAGIVAGCIRVALQNDPDVTCRHIVSYAVASEEEREYLQTADRIVAQVTDFRNSEPPFPDGMKNAGRVSLFPLVACNFLYPFAGKAHPRNAGSESPVCPGGLYQGQLSDTVLIELMEVMPDASPEALAERYLSQDYAQRTDLDRLYTLNGIKAQRIGAIAGLNLWPKIDRMFRDTPLFWTYLHPAGLLLRAICRHVLEQLRLGLDETALNAALATVREPFGCAHMPLHPSVVRHFGVDWAPPDFRYRFMPEGGFTAKEFAMRYIRFEHDIPLTTAIFNLHQDLQVPVAIAELEQARHRQPDNADIMVHLAIGYWKQGRLQQAMEAAVSAVERDPDQAEWATLICIVARSAGLTAPQSLDSPSA